MYQEPDVIINNFKSCRTRCLDHVPGMDDASIVKYILKSIHEKEYRGDEQEQGKDRQFGE